MTTPWHRSPEILAALDAYALAYLAMLAARSDPAQAQWTSAGDLWARAYRELHDAIKASEVARTTNGSKAKAPEPQSVGSSDPQERTK